MARLTTKFITDNVVTNTKLSQIATQTIKGRTSSGSGNVEDLTSTQATAILNVMVGDSGSGGTKGLVPTPAIGDATKFLRGDGTFANSGTFSGDISPTTWAGLANNTLNQVITGLLFSSDVDSFECLMNIQIDATVDTWTTIKLLGTRKAALDWSAYDLQMEFTANTITGLSFDITTTGQVRISIGAITGFVSGSTKFRAIALT